MENKSQSNHSMSTSVLLAFAAIYLIWGSTYLAIRIGIETVPPFLLAGIRFCVAGALLYAWMRLSGVPRPKLRMWRSAAIIGLLMMFGGNGLVTWAQQTVPSGLAALLVATVPIWMVLLESTVYGGGYPGNAVVFGQVAGLVGLAILLGPGEGAVDPVGAAVPILAALAWATGSLLNRTATLPESPWMAAAMEMLCGGGAMVLVSLATGEWAGFDPSTVSTRSFLAFLYLIVFGSIVGLSAYVYLLRETSAAAVSTYAFVNPVVALVLGWWVGEAIGLRTLAGAAMIVGAVVLIHWTKHRAARRELELTRSWKPAVAETECAG